MECVIEECPTATLRARAPGVTTCSIPHVTAQTRVRGRASERALLCGICIVHCPCEEYRYDCRGIRLKGVNSVNVGRLRFSSNEVDALSDHHIRGVHLVRPPVNESGGRRVL